jgi:hypothetical protein
MPILNYTDEYETDDREKAIELAKKDLMALFGLTEWPAGVTIDAVAEYDDDEYTGWEFEVIRG